AVGGALAASAGTVICGLGLMALAEFAKVRSGGPAIAVSLAVALAASLTLAPALLRLLGRSVFWPIGARGPGGRDRPGPRAQRDRRVPLTEPREGVWGWISRKVVAHPLAVWGISVALLVPLAVIGFTVKANYRATGELSPTTGSVEGLA